jgi:hypothetical protein
MTKLEYYIHQLYILRPPVTYSEYEKNTIELCEKAKEVYIDYLRKNIDTHGQLLLNIKEYAYFDLTVSFKNYSEDEKEKIIRTYYYLIDTATLLIQANIALRSSKNIRYLNDQINTLVAFTQFWDSTQWDETRPRIEKIISYHKKRYLQLH